MKINPAVTIASAVLFAAGCAHEQHQARYDETISPSYSSGRMSDYNNKTGENNISSWSDADANSAHTSGSASDNTIVAQARESLERNPEIAVIMPNIQISANNGAILLNGSVQSEEQSRQIVALVQQTSGVMAVNNQLKVISTPRNTEYPNNLQLNPTSDNDNSSRLYKDAGNGMDASTNNALNQTSHPKGDSQIYQQGNQNQNATNTLNEQQQNTNGNQMP